MLETEAWLSLKPAARAVYIAIAGRYKGETIANNGFLAASVRDLASECLIDKNTVTASLNDLIERGLIERTQEGSFSCKIRLAAEYRLTSYRCDRTGEKATNAFRQWRGGKTSALPEGLQKEEGGNHVQAGI
jgi:predicted transcriptional regulator